MRTPRRSSRPNGQAPYTPPRGAFAGKGKQKRDVVSTTGQSLRRSGRGRKVRVDIPPGTTGELK